MKKKGGDDDDENFVFRLSIGRGQSSVIVSYIEVVSVCP